MKVLFVESDKPNQRQQSLNERRKEILRSNGYEVVTKAVDSCRHGGLKYDTIFFDESEYLGRDNYEETNS